MDKLRALQYFVAAAQERSFSGAARQMEVSVPAVARLIGALERSLGVSLFERTVHGLSPTADGTRYLESCLPVLEQLAAADDALRSGAVRPSGTLVVGASPIISQHCILPALPQFHERYPDIHIDVRNVDRPGSPQADAAELLVLYGWPRHPGMVHRPLVSTRALICASPDYWARHGVPRTLEDLERHPCLLFRDQEGTVIDYWEHELDGRKASISAKGWLVSSHRDIILDACMAGMGVARFTDVSIREPLRTGRLVPVLKEWESRHAPPISLMYRASRRRLPRVRAFIDFLTEVFAQMERERTPDLAVRIGPERPPWYKRRHNRASATPREKTASDAAREAAGAPPDDRAGAVPRKGARSGAPGRGGRRTA